MARFTLLIRCSALTLACSLNASAQSLTEPSPVTSVFDVTQFGVPRDAKYIFCNEADCPERSTKTMTAPKTAAAPGVAAPKTVMAGVMPQSIHPPVELSPAKVEYAKRVKKRVVRPKRRATKMGCGPDIKK